MKKITEFDYNVINPLKGSITAIPPKYKDLPDCRCERLKEIFKIYSSHSWNCAWPKEGKECDCGYDYAVKEVLNDL
jgi:hypothetical protein